MSLAVLADHMASKGRGPDSMLIHMSPREVQGLQALAEHHGGSLTINPETGLPEAGFLDKLLPTILGAGLTFMGVPPNVSAMIVGGIQTVRTGDLGKGIQAGLGAYGGANLTSSMMTAGTEALGASPEAMSGMASGTQAAMLEAQTAGMGEGLSQGQMLAQQNAGMGFDAATASPYDKLSKGFDAAKDSPMKYLKANAMPLAAAFGPAILAEMNVKNNMPQTVTRPPMIAPYASFGGQFVAGNPYQATPTRGAEGGLMGMNDGGYSPGQLNFAQQSEPVVRMADGGSTVRMAKGVPPAMLTDEQLYQKSGLSGKAGWDAAAKARDAQNVALNNYNLTDNAAVGTNINKWITDNPNASTVDINTAIKNSGLTQDLVNPYLTANTNISDPARYALSHASEMPGGGGLAGLNANILKEFATNPGMNQASIDRLQDIYKVSDADIQRPLSHGFQVANTDIAKAQNYLNTNPDVMAWINSAEGKDYIKKNPEFDALDIAYTHYKRYGEGEQRKWEAPAVKTTGTGGTGGTGTDTTTNIPSGYHLENGVLVPNISSTQNTSTNVTTPTGINVADASALPVGVSGAGITTINPNGTITTRPDLSLEMQDVRDAYTTGGGSLGVNKNLFAPTTTKQIEDRYKLTGGSRQAMDYLTGKTKYTPIPYTEDGQISKSYAESAMKIPVASSSKMYIFKNGKYEVNPEYAIPTYDKDGKKSLNLTVADVRTFMDKKPSSDVFYTWATTNNLSPEQIALASERPINEISKLFTGAKDLVGEDGKIDQTKVDEKAAEKALADEKEYFDEAAYLAKYPDVKNELTTGKAAGPYGFTSGYEHYMKYVKDKGVKTHYPIFKAGYTPPVAKAGGGLMAMARNGMSQQFDLGGYSDGGRLLRGPGDGVSDSIPATIGNKRPARLADGEFVVPARIVSELGNGSTEAGARKLYAMMDRVQSARRGTVGKGRVAKNSRSEKYLPA